MQANPKLLQWREEGVNPPHLEKRKVKLQLMVGEGMVEGGKIRLGKREKMLVCLDKGEV